MGKVLEKVEQKAKAAEDLQKEYIDTLHWCVKELDTAIEELVKARTDILTATREHLHNIVERTRDLTE